MDLTLIALLVVSLVLIGLHIPHTAIALFGSIVLAVLATRLSWAFLQSFSTVQVPQRVRD
ncbi:MAG: hypothetical protein AAFU71_11320 [Cyanobacteria bacterium J06632_22]